MTNLTATLKTSIVNGETFTLTPTYQEMDDQVLMHLADQMLREVGGRCCVNSEIEFILKHAESDYNSAPFCRDDITNNGPTGEIVTLEGEEITMTEEERDQFVSEMEDLLLEEEENDGAGEDTSNNIQHCIDDANDNYIEDYPEIMQWLALDERLIYRLEEMGECTLSGAYWGRCAYGQSITMDSCIKRICYDLAMCWAK